jgi:hypothetical protein
MLGNELPSANVTVLVVVAAGFMVGEMGALQCCRGTKGMGKKRREMEKDY